MEYNIKIEPLETSEGLKWVAVCPALNGAQGSGDTPESALEVLRHEMNKIVESMEDKGLPLPAPEYMLPVKTYSGRITYRPGKRLHQVIEHYANEYDVSINSLINSAVTTYLARLDDNMHFMKVVKNYLNLDEKRILEALEQANQEENYDHQQVWKKLDID